MSHGAGGELHELHQLLDQLQPVTYGIVKIVLISLLQTHTTQRFIDFTVKPISAGLDSFAKFIKKHR